MIRRESLDQPVNHERWLVSYADFITLLFAFFVVMYSISYVNEDKYRSLAETLNTAFSNSSASTISPSPVTQLSSSALAPPELADLSVLQQTFAQTLTGLQIVGELVMGANEQWLELSLSAELLFASGSAAPSAQAKALFGELAASLEQIDNEIQVSGHTDNVPINNQQFANNWALSSARAIAIVDYLSFQGIDARRLSAVAFGEHRPLVANDTAQGRAQNRRVVMRIGRGAPLAIAQSPPTEQTDTAFLPEQANNSDPINATSIGRNLEPSISAADNKPDAESARNTVQPVRLEGGDLLFTSDPDLPRLRRRQTDTEPEPDVGAQSNSRE